jgi:hypothetical protein
MNTEIIAALRRLLILCAGFVLYACQSAASPTAAVSATNIEGTRPEPSPTAKIPAPTGTFTGVFTPTKTAAAWLRITYDAIKYYDGPHPEFFAEVGKIVYRETVDVLGVAGPEWDEDLKWITVRILLRSKAQWDGVLGYIAV